MSQLVDVYSLDGRKLSTGVIEEENIFCVTVRDSITARTWLKRDIVPKRRLTK